MTGCVSFGAIYGSQDLIEVIEKKNHKALHRKTLLRHNIVKELFDLAKAWHWQTPSQMLENVSRVEIAHMLAHQRLCNVMNAIQNEDDRPKGKGK